ncbi:MAG: hypothetical protein K6T51_01390 [Rubrobacteraceae bacterium]|nr:hypothetical protein [Rubrobacteraceae bacterium]
MSDERKSPYLPPGYRVVLSDPEVVQLLAPWNDVIFVWSRYGTGPEKVEALAWDHYQRSQRSTRRKEAR